MLFGSQNRLNILALMLKVSRNKRDAGFSLPLAMGFGLIMVLVAITLSIKAQDDRVAAISQNQTMDSLTIAEGGMSRTLGFLNHNYNALLQLNYDPNGLLGSSTDEWSSFSFPPPCFQGLNDIVSGKIPAAAATNNYTLEAYRFNDPDGIADSGDETGTLIVKGHPSGSTATSRIQQTMNINEASSAASFPGLMAQDIVLGNNDVLGAIAGNVLCTNSSNCVVPPGECVNGQPTDDGLRTAVGALNNGEVEGQIYINNVVWPTLPTMPSDAISVTIDGTETFPRKDTSGNITDTLGADGAYHYDVSEINLNGSEKVTIDTTDAPVYFHVSGDIDMGGNTTLNHVCTGTANNCGTYGSGLGSPDRFQIYGLADDGDAFTDQDFTLNGGSTSTNVFIHAPDARMGINGGSSSPDIFGAVWVREWNGSSSNNAEIVVPNEMKSLLAGANVDLTSAYFRTSSATSWSQIEDN